MKAAIDIGSNGIRLVIAPISEHGKLKTFRAPVRLGQDVFEDGYISNKSLSLLVDALLLFKKKMHASGVTLHKIVATSALREAKNKRKVVDEVAKKTQLKIDIIDGHLEAELIHEAVCERVYQILLAISSKGNPFGNDFSSGIITPLLGMWRNWQTRMT